MDRLDAIRVFVRVVESGSFSAVARESGTGQPAVSKQVASLEAHLGTQLLRRTSRSMSLTEAGQEYYESALKFISDLEAAESRIGRGQVSPSGLVCLAAAPAFGRLYIAPQLRNFLARYPEITVELQATDRMVNLVEEGVDLSIHTGELADSSLVARKIASTPVITVASREYLETHGEPVSPSELDQHQCVVYAPLRVPRAWGFKGKFGPLSYEAKGSLRSNDAEQIRAAVLSGLGLAHTPGWLFAPEIDSGEVRLVMRDYEPPVLPISALHPAGRRLATKVRVMLDFLVETFAAEPGLRLF